MTRTWMLAIVVLLGCASDAPEVPASITPGTVDEQHPPPPPPVEEALGCRGAFVAGPQRMRAARAAGAACAIHPRSAQPYFMDACDPVGWTAGCKIEFGAQFCMNGQWTTACVSDAQCPAGSRCTDGAVVGDIDREYSDYGWCAPTCKPSAGAAACDRCGLECEPDLGVCMQLERPSPGSVAKHGAGPMERPVRHERSRAATQYRPSR